MNIKTIDIRNSSSAEYARLDIYGLEATDEMPSSKLRPMAVICPGGAYAYTSKREGEPVAMKVLSAGIHAAVLWYSTKPYSFPTSITEVASAVYYIRSHAEELHVDVNRIYVMGFSAGGHLAASYACFWNCRFLRDALNLTDAQSEMLKPNGLILGYPVITSDEKTHEDSIINIMGEDDSILKSDAVKEIVGRLNLSTAVDKTSFRAALALENQVSDDTPETFIWHTRPDGCVPVENTLRFVNALQAHDIGYELHIYPNGGHGLSLANRITDYGDGSTIFPEIQKWIDDACRWISER